MHFDAVQNWVLTLIWLLIVSRSFYINSLSSSLLICKVREYSLSLFARLLNNTKKGPSSFPRIKKSFLLIIVKICHWFKDNRFFAQFYINVTSWDCFISFSITFSCYLNGTIALTFWSRVLDQLRIWTKHETDTGQIITLWGDIE